VKQNLVFLLKFCQRECIVIFLCCRCAGHVRSRREPSFAESHVQKEPTLDVSVEKRREQRRCERRRKCRTGVDVT
jgi:hypothetical protein